MGKSKKKKSVAKQLEDDASIPRSFVFHRGTSMGSTLAQLVADMRHVMEPYTAVKLKVRKSNVMKDFVNMAGPLGISHFIIFSKTDMSPYMKLCRLPRGPTITFRINEYSLMRDVVSIQKRPKTIGSQFKFPPLLVLNNFSSDTLEMKLTTTMLQNLYPPIKIQKVQLGDIRRCAMFNFDSETNTVNFRQYHIEAVPVGVSRGVKKLLKSKVPDLGSLSDISDFVNGGAYLSESEGEEAEDSRVKLPQNVPGRGNVKSSQSAMRLTELGPRMTLELIKIEDGVCEGEVLFHKYVEKSAAEIKKQKRAREKVKKAKNKRKLEQQQNVERKEMEKVEHREKSLAGMKRKNEDNEEEKVVGSDDDSAEGSDAAVESSDVDDAEYYRREVGEDPDQDMFQSKKKKVLGPPRKKVKFSAPKKQRVSTDQVDASRLRKSGNPPKKSPKNTKQNENEKPTEKTKTKTPVTKRTITKKKFTPSVSRKKIKHKK